MSILYIDFETFSVCDLKVRGLDNYAHDPSTGIHCLAYAFGEEPVELWYPGINPMPMSFFRVLEHIGADGTVMAHNVAFELAIWNQVCAPKYLWPTLMPEQCRCTMCMAYAMGLPGSLENAAAALGLPQRKDNLGKRIMLKACRPKEDGTFWKFEDDPAMFRELFAYCQQDVEVERALHHRLLELSPGNKLSGTSTTGSISAVCWWTCPPLIGPLRWWWLRRLAWTGTSCASPAGSSAPAPRSNSSSSGSRPRA